MIRKHKNTRLILILTSMIGLILSLSIICISCWGSPTFKIIIENQTEYALTIYINDYEIGNVNPNDQLVKSGIPWDTGKYNIKAKNAQGVSVFSETLTREQMQKIENRVYKVVIPPSLNST